MVSLVPVIHHRVQTFEEGDNMCKKAVAVDTALRTLVKEGQSVEINSTFIKKWAEKAREFGGSLSAKRIEKAIKALKLKVSVTSCANQHFQSAGWMVNI